MLIPIETWTILSVDDEKGVISHVVGAYCPMGVGQASLPDNNKTDRDVCPTNEGLPCLSGLGRCEYFHYADSKGIECIYNEVETDIIDGEIQNTEYR